MKFLGIRNGHDNNLTYTDGTKVRYIKFERNFQKKHYYWDNDRTIDDVSIMLKKGEEILGVDFTEVDAICINNTPDLHPLKQQVPPLETSVEISKKINPYWDQFKCPVYLIDHHYAHVLSTFPLVDVTKVKQHFVVDGEGDHLRWATYFKNDKISRYIDTNKTAGISKLLEDIGVEYGMKGFRLDVSGKVMALKSFHNFLPHQVDAIMENFLDTKLEDTQEFILSCENFMRKSGIEKNQQLINLAYLLHVFGEGRIPEFMSRYAKPDDVITYSGGTAQNTVINTKIKQKFKNLHIPPHCPDDGISLGCVEFLRQKYNQPLFDNSNFPYWQSDEAPTTQPIQATIDKAAEYLAQGKIVGWYQGNGEVGPRALGNRSILMNPAIKDGKDIINTKVKKREPYRPFGASVLVEHASKLFDCDFDSPYMLYVVDCLTKDYPSITHVDNTCRIQTVDQKPQFEVYYNLIDKFNTLTGIPVVLNTSLNVDGKPIAGHISDAKKLYEDSELDVLIVGNDIMVK